MRTQRLCALLAARFSTRWAALLVLMITGLASPLRAAPSQDDVFKSIQDSMGKPTEFDSRPVILLAGGGAVAVLLLALGSRRQQAGGKPKALNNSAKLLKEVLRGIPLKSAEVKQLKALAESIQLQNGQEASPLTLLLCPSLIAKGVQQSSGRVDRKVIARIVRKLRSLPPA